MHQPVGGLKHGLLFLAFTESDSVVPRKERRGHGRGRAFLSVLLSMPLVACSRWMASPLSHTPLTILA